jgi:hypothetical protein
MTTIHRSGLAHLLPLASDTTPVDPPSETPLIRCLECLTLDADYATWGIHDAMLTFVPSDPFIFKP